MNLLDPLALLMFLHLNFCQSISCSCLVPHLQVSSTSTKKKHNMSVNGTETNDILRSPPKDYNDYMMKEAKKFLKEQLKLADVIIVAPASPLRRHTCQVAASNLTIGYKPKVPVGEVDYTTLNDEYHFWGITFTEVYPESNDAVDVISKTLLDPFDTVNMIAVLPHVLECESEISCRLDRLLDKGDKLRIRNETELRYAIGDPILDMLCNVGGYKVCVCVCGLFGGREGGRGVRKKRERDMYNYNNNYYK